MFQEAFKGFVWSQDLPDNPINNDFKYRNNDNLGRLASKIVSPLVFAHVSLQIYKDQDVA